MYCGRKKYSPSSSHASIISRVFQVSWFPKSKQKAINPAKKSAKPQHRDNPDFPIPNSPLPALWKEGRFYSVDDDEDDAYWRLSFREQRTEDRKSIPGIIHLSSDSDDKFQIPVPSFTGIGSREFTEKQYKEHVTRKHEACRRKNKNGEEKLTTPGKKDRLPRNLRPDDGELKPSTPVEKDIFPVEEDYYAFGGVSIPEWQNTDEINDITEFQRKSHCRKIKQKNRANNYSPKREFRVRMLEDMKKERMRSKKKETKEQGIEGRTVYDSFAEVKTSFDPQQDFRDSMVEMICEKQIRRAEDLEDLLTCYLTLNDDEYHDLIIKVFQQVCFELSRGGVC